MNAICQIKGCTNHTEPGKKYCKYHTVETSTLEDRIAQSDRILVKVCTHEGCGRPAKSKGLCSTHYNQMWRKTRTSIPNKCKEEGCDRDSRCRGYCSTHYEQHRKELIRRGEFENKISTKSKPRICSIPGCGKPHKGRGYCSTHYNQIYNGDRPKRERRRSKPRVINATYMPCIIDGCNSHQERRGMCLKHVRLMGKNGFINLNEYERVFGVVEAKPMDIVKAPSRLQPIDPNIALAYYGSIIEELSQYKQVIKIAREMFEMKNKITVINLSKYNDKNRLYITEHLYRLYYKYNMGLVPFVKNKEK